MSPPRPEGSASSQPGEEPPGGVFVRHRIPTFSELWVIPEVPVPEAAWHDRALTLLRALLDYWIRRTARDAAVYRNLAVRVRKNAPKVGFDPDICLVQPAPPDAMNLSSLQLWKPGHVVPALAVEVVSPGHPYKDYSESPDKCAAVGMHELVVFDPLLVGPKALGGPHRMQLWQRTEQGHFDRTYCGEGPAASAVLDAHWVSAPTGCELRIASDPLGQDLWLTAEEAERALKEHERTLKEAALARVAQLEAELRRRGAP